jgi:DNA-binding LytR/AlgR family response regulator
MDGINGYTAAKKLKSVRNPPLIIFITNSAEYTYRGYEVAFRYLPKPVTFEILSDVLSSAIEQIAPLKLTITESGRTHIIHINDILYFESSGHRLAIHTKESTYECHMKLYEMESLLPADGFALPHKGYLVNLDYVDSVRESRLILKGDVQIPVSRRHKKPRTA